MRPNHAFHASESEANIKNERETLQQHKKRKLHARVSRSVKSHDDSFFFLCCRSHRYYYYSSRLFAFFSTLPGSARGSFRFHRRIFFSVASFSCALSLGFRLWHSDTRNNTLLDIDNKQSDLCFCCFFSHFLKRANLTSKWVIGFTKR